MFFRLVTRPGNPTRKGDKDRLQIILRYTLILQSNYSMINIFKQTYADKDVAHRGTAGLADLALRGAAFVCFTAF